MYELTAASTGTSWPARSLVSSGVIIIAPTVEHLQRVRKKITDILDYRWKDAYETQIGFVYKFMYFKGKEIKIRRTRRDKESNELPSSK